MKWHNLYANKLKKKCKLNFKRVCFTCFHRRHAYTRPIGRSWSSWLSIYLCLTTSNDASIVIYARYEQWAFHSSYDISKTWICIFVAVMNVLNGQQWPSRTQTIRNYSKWAAAANVVDRISSIHEHLTRTQSHVRCHLPHYLRSLH